MREAVDELTFRIRFDRTRISTADLIRQILSSVEVRDLLIEDEPIEEIIKRIYAGGALHEIGDGSFHRGAACVLSQRESLRMSSRAPVLAPYREFSRIGFVNILAFRLRYYTGIITYLINVTVYYFIWSAVYRAQRHFKRRPGRDFHASAATTFAQILTYVSVGWIIRSFYWNTIDQEMAYEVIEGKIAMELIKPVSIQWMWIARAVGESGFRLLLLTAPTALVIAFYFPRAPAGVTGRLFWLFVVAVVGSIPADGGLQLHDWNLRHSVEVHPGP